MIISSLTLSSKKPFGKLSKLIPCLDFIEKTFHQMPLFVGVKIVSGMLGHASAGFTLDTYTRDHRGAEKSGTNHEACVRVTKKKVSPLGSIQGGSSVVWSLRFYLIYPCLPARVCLHFVFYLFRFRYIPPGPVLRQRLLCRQHIPLVIGAVHLTF